MKKLLFALGVALWLCAPAHAQVASAYTVSACGAQSNPAGQPFPLTMDLTGNLCGSISNTSAAPLYVTASGQPFVNVASTTLTRPNDTTAYTAATTVCAAKSVTACAPLTASIANTNAGKGFLNRFNLLKTGATTTNASFTAWLFSAAPGVASPTQYDNVAYAGPRLADMPNFIGEATCSTATATSDTSPGVWYECSLSNPNSAGALEFQALAGSTNIDILLSVTAAYTPVANEQFTAYLGGFY